jgi:hypothetical protein
VAPLPSTSPDRTSHASADGIETCYANVPNGFDQGTTQLPTYFERKGTTIAAVERRAAHNGASRVEYLPHAALVVAPNNTVRLCAAKRTEAQTVCTDGPLVTGIDAASIRTEHPGAFQVIEGPMLVRSHGTTIDLVAFTHGYTTSPFSPSS